MFYVIAEPCIGVKDKACVEVCPVDCIHGDENSAQMFINPQECIFCGSCEPECPVEAIFEVDKLPEKWQGFEQKNSEFFARREENTK